MRKAFAGVALALTCFGQVRAEVVLQYFNTSWNEIATRMPEVAEAGYTALWLPPPYQAGSQGSVGYDCYNRFNFGSDGVVTRYGNADDLLNMVRTAHRFGIRVYFDTIAAHNGGPLPDTVPGTLTTTQPGFVPEDFHLIVNTNGTYSLPPSSIDYNNNEWQVLNRSAFGLDIAQENPNASFGATEGSTYAKWSGVRQPSHPEWYPNTNATAFVDGQGKTNYPFSGNGQAVGEDVNAMLIRAVRWFLDQSKCDGFRLDDVKGTPSYFFGEQYAGNKDSSSAGYCGAIQAQFNITHGFDSWSNLRGSLFDTEAVRKNAMIFGEDLGQPNPCQFTCQQGYVDAGMRIDDNAFYSRMFQAVCGGCSGGGNGLWGLDQPGAYAFGGSGTGLSHAGSHDYNDLSEFDLTSANALLLTRLGLASVYTDGYNMEQTIQSNGKYFPSRGKNKFLGQFKSDAPAAYLPNLLYIHQLFARGSQAPKWSDQDYCAYERRDKRENGSMSDSDGTVLLFMMARNGSGGASRNHTTAFPVGARLINYSTYNNAFGFGATVDTNGFLRNDSNQLIVAPAGGYWAFSWSVPGMPSAWNDGMWGQVQPITILQNGQQVGTLSYVRKDGRNGDPNFNPYDVPNYVGGNTNYTMTVPLVTNPSNLTFIARADGSTANILMKLDGGIDLNSQMGIGPQTGGKRDQAPGVATDVFLGYEQMGLVQRIAEKFAARDVSRNVIGSPGCETYQATIGSAGFTVNNGSGPNTSVGTVTWVYHDPVANNQLGSPTLQFFPAPQSAAGQSITIWTKIGYTNQPQQAYLYYTTNGVAFPEGSGGVGKGTTLVLPLASDSDGVADGSGTPVWWKTTLPAMPSGTVLRYKVGVYRTDAAPWFPFSASDINMKKRMEAIYQITNFNAQTVFFYPHNDYGVTQTGLDEGFHVLRTKPFIKRDNPTRASIYNLNVQTFYYDTKAPEGEILFPPNDGDTLTGTNYGVVVRADRSTTEAWYRITDSNGTGAWTQAAQIAPPTSGLNTSYPLEWRFDYNNIPNNDLSATIEVRLRELTSSTNMNLTDDVAGHFKRLTRTVFTGQPQDTVGDGIPDSWRAQFFGSNGQTTNSQSCATCDPDGDGMNNSAEYNSGTDPTNSVSALRIVSITPAVNGYQITWTSVSNKNYQVWSASDPSQSFSSLSGTITASGNTTDYTDSSSPTGGRVYKVKLLP